MLMEESKKTTLNVSISSEDKKFLKMYALQHDVSVSALVEAWIQQLKQEQTKE